MEVIKLWQELLLLRFVQNAQIACSYNGVKRMRSVPIVARNCPVGVPIKTAVCSLKSLHKRRTKQRSSAFPQRALGSMTRDHTNKNSQQKHSLGRQGKKMGAKQTLQNKKNSLFKLQYSANSQVLEA
jgi:hypothetical protein